ncbi:MAG: hypothetical protein HKM04_09110 [Legionellales bacterium]|nr:hypothetical protein [Legionellales bacterium]
MSEYQYYEFCRIGSPLSAEARKTMQSLSSRAKVSTHGASYTYNYGDFRGKPAELVLNYFDVFFYISNFGTLRLIFKYPENQITEEEIEKYRIKHVIHYQKHEQYGLLTIDINNEEGFGWTEGEGLLADLLPLYDEIKDNHYHFLQVVSAVHDHFMGENSNTLSNLLTKNTLSSAEKTFVACVGL